MLAVFDFDRTVTCLHTFRKAQMYEEPVSLFYPEQYLRGKQDALTNVKKGISDHLKHDDGEHSSAIATFHNNHSMVAGYLSVIFGKELILQETHLSADKLIAVAQYRVEGIEKPFFISYINACGPHFNPTLHALGKSKNKQLIHLRQLIHTLNPEQAETEITFYDDDLNNCRQAALLPLTRVFHVHTAFCETFVCDPWHESLKADMPSPAAASSSNPHGFFGSSSASSLESIKIMISEHEHDRVEDCVRNHGANPSFIAGFYAEKENHEMVEKYLKKYQASVNVIIQAYVNVGCLEKVSEYQQRFNIPDSDVDLCFARAAYSVTETPPSEQASGSHPGL